MSHIPLAETLAGVLLSALFFAAFAFLRLPSEGGCGGECGSCAGGLCELDLSDPDPSGPEPSGSHPETARNDGSRR